MNRIVFILVCVVFASSVFGEGSEKTKMAKLEVHRSDSTGGAFFDPFLVAGASLVVPGTGQMYTRHYIKGGMFLASEAITASSAIYWFKDANITKRDATKTLLQRAERDTGTLKVQRLNDAGLSKYDERYSRYRAYNTLAWAGGLYVYNFLDAIECTNIINKSGERNPLRAGLLSAIPGLALGQYYNGSISKAGMIFMAQMSMGVVALNYHRLMTYAEDHYFDTRDNFQRQIINAFEKGQDTLALSASQTKYMSSWESERKSAFQSRNTWLWYSIFFYFYGVIDAVVDAHLHDYPEKMRMYPDLVPQSNGALLRLNVKF